MFLFSSSSLALLFRVRGSAIRLLRPRPPPANERSPSLKALAIGPRRASTSGRTATGVFSQPPPTLRALFHRYSSRLLSSFFFFFSFLPVIFVLSSRFPSSSFLPAWLATISFKSNPDNPTRSNFSLTIAPRVLGHHYPTPRSFSTVWVFILPVALVVLDNYPCRLFPGVVLSLSVTLWWMRHAIYSL